MIACAIVAAVASAAAPAAACECIDYDQASAVAAHDVAFRGTVTSIARAGADDVVTLRVEQAWRGTSAGAVIAVRRSHDDFTRTDCPVPIVRAGVRYEVFASRDEGGALRLGGCNPTRPSSTPLR